MIKNIYIKNFAIIDELHINFEDGFNVFTGETGAGKSIIVGALSFIKGNRADSSYIRTGTNEALIKATFGMNERLESILMANGFEVSNDLIVERKMTLSGNNTIKINGMNATLSFLASLLNDEIDIHSQKQAQYLLKSQNHLTLLDKYLDNQELINKVRNQFQVYMDLKNELADYMSANDSQQDIDYYEFQVKEIEDANLSVEEEEKLKQLEKRIKSSEKIVQSLSLASSLFEQSGGIKESLYEACHAIDIEDDKVQAIHEKLYDKYYELEDLFGGLSDILDSLDFSEEDCNRVQERLFIINKLKRKYQKDIDEILEYKDSLIKKIDNFNHQSEYLASFNERINAAHEEYINSAKQLSEARQIAAKKLAKEVIEEVSVLELNYFDFEIAISEKDESFNGIDNCIFNISTNKGEELKPLTKVASGGEMSRIMLGLKTLFSRLMGVSLVVFDEIDTGVSGKAATAIGLKMAKIATYTQVLSITHLAQVASFADAHYFVSKSDFDGRTVSHIDLLDYDQRIDELALMALSSVDENTRKVAYELLESSNNKKNELCR